MRDVFAPKHEPAKSIYEAFVAEAANRKTRRYDTWMDAEVEAVHKAAVAAAERHGMRAPELQEVQRAERYARGSIDYGLKWACQVVEAMRRAEPLK